MAMTPQEAAQFTELKRTVQFLSEQVKAMEATISGNMTIHTTIQDTIEHRGRLSDIFVHGNKAGSFQRYQRLMFKVYTRSENHYHAARAMNDSGEVGALYFHVKKCSDNIKRVISGVAF